MCQLFNIDYLAYIYIYVYTLGRAPNFHLPVDSLQPVIMIGPGTGIAPFRSFWEERMYQLKHSKGDFGEMYLFFGCRQRAVDSLYEPELKEAKEAGALKEYFIALSREPNLPRVSLDLCLL